MLYFREYRWLCDVGRTRFSAHIRPKDATRDDVDWSLDLHYVAGGSIWRRVARWLRPAFHLTISTFKAPARSWRDLEHLSFWNSQTEEDALSSLTHARGWIDVRFRPRQAGVSASNTFAPHFLWRVAGREDRFFIVEI